MWYLVILIYLSATNVDVSKAKTHSFGSWYVNNGNIKNGTHIQSGTRGVTTNDLTHFANELVKVVCQPSDEWAIQSFIYYSHYKNDNEHIREFISSNCTTIYKKLDDNEHVVNKFHCDLINEHTSAFQTMKLQFSLRENKNQSNPDYPVFSVNGLVLRPEKPIAHELSFLYEYYQNETLNVSVIVDHRFYELIKCNFGGRISTFSLYKSGGIQIKLEEKHSNLIYNCTTLDTIMTLVFRYDAFDNEPYVTGLSLSKTLLKYKSSYTSTTIVYEASPGDVIEVTFSSESLENLKFNSSEVKVTNNTKKYSNKYHVVAKIEIYLASRSTVICSTSRNGIRYETRLEFVQTGGGSVKNVVSEKKKGSQRKQTRKPENETVIKIYETIHNYSIHQTEKVFWDHIIPPNYYKDSRPKDMNEIKDSRLKDMNEIKDSRLKDMIGTKVSTDSEDVGIIKPSVVIGVASSCILIIIVIIVIVCVIRFKARNKKSIKENHLHYANMDMPQGTDALATVEGENVYETVAEPTYDDPYAVCNLHGSQAPEGITQRPLQPLPSEDREENKPYIHYDTPYEFRIFRIGVPVRYIPDRFKRRMHT